MEKNIMNNLPMRRPNDFQPFHKKKIPCAHIKDQHDMCPHDIYYAKALMHSDISLIPTNNEKSNQRGQYSDSKSLPAIVSPDTSRYSSTDKNSWDHHAMDTRGNFLNVRKKNKKVYSVSAEYGSPETIKVSLFA